MEVPSQPVVLPHECLVWIKLKLIKEEKGMGSYPAWIAPTARSGALFMETTAEGKGGTWTGAMTTATPSMVRIGR